MAVSDRVHAGFFVIKFVDQLVVDIEGGFKCVVGLLDLTVFGIGVIIGIGIFVIFGEVIGDFGFVIIFSFVLVGVMCAFFVLFYVELVSTIFVLGSVYMYGYATMGELVVWIIGWDLIFEYVVLVVVIVVGWG